ncbi:hypothetical protein [Streptomyces griseofuscus]|uniref:hypothetical protein n=1 Tax=Streptomyces griseofuscus TaxID=146922 RepID=UPI003820E958
MTDRTLHRGYEDPPVYSQEIVQVRADTTSKARVVLAGEFNRHLGDLPTALATYEAKPRLLRLAMPMTRRAIGAFQAITAPACRLHVPDLAARLSKEDRGGTWQLPREPGTAQHCMKVIVQFVQAPSQAPSTWRTFPRTASRRPSAAACVSLARTPHIC